MENAPTIDPTAEAIRREHLRREASIHALGVLYYVIGAIILAGMVFALGTGGTAGLEVRPGYWGAIDVTVYVAAVVVTFVVGHSLHRLRSWARVAAIVICSLGLLRIPVGTLVLPYFLYVLLSAKGKRVFAPDYGAILAATPHLSYPRLVVVWTVLGVVLAVAALRYAVRFAVQN
jgi:hypothetical protein